MRIRSQTSTGDEISRLVTGISKFWLICTKVRLQTGIWYKIPPPLPPASGPSVRISQVEIYERVRKSVIVIFMAVKDRGNLPSLVFHS